MFGPSAVRTFKSGCGAVRICCACGMMTMSCIAGEDSAGTNHIQAAATVNETSTNAPVEEPEIQRKNIIDTVQGSASSRLVSLARWVDSFFDDPEYAEEEADARASLTQTVTFYRNVDPVYRTRVRASLILPNLSRRFRLTFEGNDDLDQEDAAGNLEETLAESTQESIDDPSLRLQYLFLHEPDVDLGMSGGVRLNESAFYAGPRLKLRAGLGAGWDAKFTQRTYWYTTDNVKAKTELRFDHLLGRRNLFRQAFRTDWNEEKHQSEGFRNTVTSSITQPLQKNAAFRYAWSSTYLTRPDPRWTSTTLSVGYRQSLWREWVIAEVTPFMRWEEQYDWGPSPGIVLGLSAILE